MTRPCLDRVKRRTSTRNAPAIGSNLLAGSFCQNRFLIRIKLQDLPLETNLRRITNRRLPTYVRVWRLAEAGEGVVARPLLSRSSTEAGTPGCIDPHGRRMILGFDWACLEHEDGVFEEEADLRRLQ